MYNKNVEEKSCPRCDLTQIEKKHQRYKELIIIGVSAILLFLGLIFEFIFKINLLAKIFFISTAIISGYNIAKKGFHSLIFQRKLVIDFLITIAAVGSFLIGHGEDGAAVVFLFYIAEFLEEYATERAKKSIEALIKLAPEVATVRRNGIEIKIPVNEINVNEIILIRPGEKIPLDGKVIRGFSTVNQAPITGESIPVPKQIGDYVYAGTINNEGFLEVKVLKKSDETMLSKIIKLVERAQKMKSPTEKFIDKFAKYYTPSIILLAICIAIIPPFMYNLPCYDWIYKALVLLVVSCPCALAISTPVAMVSAITSAARNGVLIKGSTYIEEISNIRVFAFDKTGTLTEGKLKITDILGIKYSSKDILSIAASLESLSEHPIAKAIVEEAKKKGNVLKPVEEFKATPGKGIIGKIYGKIYYIGNERMFKELSINYPIEIVKKLQDEGKTVILIGNGRKAIGIIAVMDKIRDATIKSINKLKSMGIRTEMITGDNNVTARAIAKKIGIDEYHANLLPDDKVKLIEEHLAKKYGSVAMVGDGVNDAPALAKANVGIAMGAIGSDIALETADIALMQDDLSKLPYLIELSKKTMNVVRQNIIISILVKGSFAILAFPGFITLWLAVAIGDMGLSLAVILNAMRLSLIKP